VVRIPKHIVLASEHPNCDTIQLVMLVLFFVVWIADALSYFIFSFSTILIGLALLSVRLILSFITFCVSLYLMAKAHKSVFDEKTGKPRFIDSNVYSLVRHPMYLGTLLFCLAFFFAMPSLLSLIVWIGFFIFFDKMATFEENELEKILGDEYISYQKRVSKWIPKIIKSN
jgi:protein-S-isoprenylcysteine O-methyltransferase Ste14